MLITIKREKFDSLDDSALPWACIEPVVQQIRGKSFNIKSQVYTQLTDGQRALLMFQVIYGHTRNGINEFFDHTSYFLSEQGVWGQFRNGMKYFNEKEMLQLIEEIERFYQIVQDEKYQKPEFNCGNEPHFKNTIKQIDNKLKEIMPLSLRNIGAYIRKNSNEFIEIND